MDLESRLEQEIEFIENDESLSEQEKTVLIKELYREAREIREEE